MSHRTTPTACLWCGKENDALLNPRDPNMKPHAGALTICWYCGDLAILTMDDAVMGLRKPTEQERAEALDDPLVQRILAAVAWRNKGDKG